ncbi:ribonuclease J [Candidatus Nomurabacteria bacterium]|nr:ribonuclease J [Candidatus Nomurabacteria bacterium]USN95128.1 MAG: ribonuclease J [Candidatus Nomurabacteria bacterium]
MEEKNKNKTTRTPIKRSSGATGARKNYSPKKATGGNSSTRVIRNSSSSKPAPRKPISKPSGKRSSFGSSGAMRKRAGMSRPPRPANTNSFASRNEVNVPPIEEGVLRVIPLGGVEQIGQNMTALEYGDDIIVVDAGVQFSTDDTPGIDYIIPNTAYLEKNKHKIKGLWITHGHLDHIGAIPFVIEGIGNPPIYSREFGAAMIKKKHEEFPHLPKLNMNIVDEDTAIKQGDNFTVRSFAISHTIPDSMGLLIETPLGEIAFIEDVRVDNVKGVPTEEEIKQYSRFKDRDILMLTMDSTSVWKPGFSLSENVVSESIDKIIRDTKGRLIIATFASQVERIVAIIKSAELYGRKIVIEGRSMKSNVEISKHLGIIKTDSIISLDDIKDYPPHKILMLVTGAQGEEFAALARMANKSHKYVRLEPTDTILLSSSVIPGNESDIDKLKDNLYRSDAKIITYIDSDVHASGHGNRAELEWIHRQFNYKFFMPVHGRHWMLKQHAELSRVLGTSKDNIVIPDNGSIIEIYDGGKKIRVRKEKAPSNIRMVDGFSIGNVQDVVIRDRQMLAQDGMFVVFAIVDTRTGKLKKSPDIISRGFVYLKESQELLQHARTIIKKTIEEDSRGMNPINFDLIKGDLSDNLSKFLFQKTAKRPLVIPVILSI